MTDVMQKLCGVVAGTAVKLMHVHVWKKSSLLLFIEKSVSLSYFAENVGIFLQTRLVFKATEVGYLLVMATSCSKMVEFQHMEFLKWLRVNFRFGCCKWGHWLRNIYFSSLFNFAIKLLKI